MASSNDSNDTSKYVDYLNFPPLAWKRPEGPPRVWRVIEGRRKTPDGKTLRFSIEEIPKDLEDDVVEFMLQHYISEEPMSVAIGLMHDPLAVREIRTFLTNSVRQGISVVAFTANSDPAAKPVIAGVNILCIKTAQDYVKPKGGLPYRTQCMMKYVGMSVEMSEEVDVLKRYGVDRHMSGHGLSIHPSFRGQGLAEELLRTRDDIGRTYRIPVSETLFSAMGSQIPATRVGFEVLIERNYSEILDDEGKLRFPGVTVKSMKFMGKRLY